LHNQPVITICIPAHESNLAFITQAINSVLEQSVEGWQLFVVNDEQQQKESLQRLVSQYNHPRVIYKHNPKACSMADNWNYALEQAQTDLVTLLHDDDMLAPNYVENMLLLANKFPRSACYYSGVQLINENGKTTLTLADSVKSLISPTKPIIHINGDSGLASLLNGCYIFCPTMCYRKSFLPATPFNSAYSMVTDFKFYFDTLYAGHTITGTQEKLYYYRRHNQNQTAKLTQNMMRFEEEIDFYDYVFASVNNSWHQSKKKAKAKTIIKLHLIYKVLESIFSGKFKQSALFFQFLVKKTF